MSRRFPEAIKNMPNFKEMILVGMGLAAKLVLEKEYEEAKKGYP